MRAVAKERVRQLLEQESRITLSQRDFTAFSLPLAGEGAKHPASLLVMNTVKYRISIENPP
jgi:hypothetical protein